MHNYQGFMTGFEGPLWCNAWKHQIWKGVGRKYFAKYFDCLSDGNIQAITHGIFILDYFPCPEQFNTNEQTAEVDFAMKHEGPHSPWEILACVHWWRRWSLGSQWPPQFFARVPQHTCKTESQGAVVPWKQCPQVADQRALIYILMFQW